jgi:hypothetical protein
MDKTPNANPLSLSGTASAMEDEMAGMTNANEIALTTQHHTSELRENDNPTPAMVTALRMVPSAMSRGLLMCMTRYAARIDDRALTTYLLPWICPNPEGVWVKLTETSVKTDGRR